jgi:hypothetical protein
MKKTLLLLPILLVGLSGCNIANRMISLVNESTDSINANREAVERSTAEIRYNKQLIDASTHEIEENHRNLEAAAKS